MMTLASFSVAMRLFMVRVVKHFLRTFKVPAVFFSDVQNVATRGFGLLVGSQAAGARTPKMSQLTWWPFLPASGDRLPRGSVHLP